MLQNIRERITGGWAIAFLVLMAIPFAFFGISGDFTGGSYAAKVEGVEIPVAQLENQYQAELARYAEFGTDLPAELRSLVRQGVLNNLIRETLINVHVSEQGYRISDQMITDFIQRVPEFQVDGRFSKDRYYQWLEERALTPARFEESQRESLRLQQFQRGLAATAFVTPAEYRRYLNLYGEQRRAAIATFDALVQTITLPGTGGEVAPPADGDDVTPTEDAADGGALGGLAGTWRLVQYGDLVSARGFIRRRLEHLLRHPIPVWLYKNVLPADLGILLARKSSRALGEGPDDVNPEVIRSLRAFAEKELSSGNSDTVILAHAHQAELTRWPHGEYINTGCWYRERSLARMTEEGVELCVWDGKQAVSMRLPTPAF